jgi:hypothetical protein
MRDVILRIVVFNGGQVCCKDFESDIEVAFRCIGAAIPSNELHELCADKRFFQVPAFLLFECLLESMLNLTFLDWSHNWSVTDGFEFRHLGLLEDGLCQVLLLLLGHHWSSTDEHEFRHLGLLEDGLCQVLLLLLGHHWSSTDGHEFRHLGLLEDGLCQVLLLLLGHYWSSTDGHEFRHLGLLEQGLYQVLLLLFGHHWSSTDRHEFRHLGLLEQGLCSLSAFLLGMSDFIRHFIDRNKLSQLWSEVARDQKLRLCYRLETLKQLLQHFNNYN